MSTDTAQTATEAVPNWRLQVYGFAIDGADRRKRPSKAIKERLTKHQDGRCLYCDMKIGAMVLRRGRLIALRANWDHFVPYIYSRANPRDGWVLACHVCNAIKSCRMFASVAEVRAYIEPIRRAKGYVELLTPRAVSDGE